MKKQLHTTLAVLILFLSSASLAYGQSYRESQLITVNGDTTKAYLEFAKNGELLTYYPSSSVMNGATGTTMHLAGDKTYVLSKKEVSQRKPDKLLIEPYIAIISNTKKYDKLHVKHPSAAGKMYMFLPRFVDGEVSLYKYDYLINGTFPKTRYYLVRNGQTTDVNSTGFKRDMAAYFSEDQELSKMIESKALTLYHMKQIVERFNKTKAETTTN